MKTALSRIPRTGPSPPSLPASPSCHSELGPCVSQVSGSLGAGSSPWEEMPPRLLSPFSCPACSPGVRQQGLPPSEHQGWADPHPQPASLNGLSPHKRVLYPNLQLLSRSAFQTPLLPPNSALMPPKTYMQDSEAPAECRHCGGSGVRGGPRQMGSIPRKGSHSAVRGGGRYKQEKG